MGLLTGPEIHKRVAAGQIVISPFDEKRLGPNSYNLRLGAKLLTYRLTDQDAYTESGPGWTMAGHCLDMRKEHATDEQTIPSAGLVLQPGVLYLGHTEEHTETYGLVPCLEGRSSVGRLGLCIHVTAGFGDCFYQGTWTLELTVVQPLRIYAGVEVCQIYYAETIGDVVPYRGKYQGAAGPQPSRLWRDFLRPTE